MQRFLVRRIFILLVTLWVVSMIIFAMARASGDPRGVLLSDYAGQEEWDELGRVLNQSQGGMCICRKSGTGLGVSQEGFGP